MTNKEHLNVEEIRDMFIHVSRKMVESKDILTQADKAIGDGDHGIGMARGFEAVIEKLTDQSFDSVGSLLNNIGMALLTSVGGAAGAIFGTFFRGAAKNLKDKTIVNGQIFSTMLDDGLEAVKKRGNAKRGDKTMVDALEPATLKAKEFVSMPIYEIFKAVTEEARIGMEETKEIIATLGKAKTLGERSLGHPDPGAISIYLIFKYMMEYKA
jgi:dihydroxyacetone kinase-like protein